MKKRVRVIVAGLILLCTSVASLIAFEVVYWQKIYPGVRVAGVRLEAKDVQTAQMILEDEMKKVEAITLKWGNNKWVMYLKDLGIEFDANQTAIEALRVGRSGNMLADVKDRLAAWKGRMEVEPVYAADDNQLTEAVASVAAQINIPAQEPEVKIEGQTEVVVSAGENGQEVDERLLMSRVRETVRKLTTDPVEVPVVQLRPKLTESGLERVKKRAKNLLGRKMVFELAEEKQRWEVEDDQMLIWIDPQNEGWKRVEMEGWVAELAHSIDRLPQNASIRFVTEGRAEEFKPAKDGYRVKQNELVDLMMQELTELEKGGDKEKLTHIPMSTVEPDIKTEDVNTLGIKELLGKGESWFVGSITNRIFNLAKAADALNGTLVPPGETFSFNKTVGEIAASTGYRSAFIIKDGKTILGDGGGVCQTSTTLFRAVLAAGLPIEERSAHAYRVSYYEQNYQVGFDATIFQPSPDFKFKNDTTAYVLIQTEFDEGQKKLTFYLYGTSDGRKAEISKARTWDVIPPPPDLYIDDPTLATGVIRQTEHRAAGSRVAFDWKVIRGDEVLQERTFYSVYRPWQAVYLRGTKVN